MLRSGELASQPKATGPPANKLVMKVTSMPAAITAAAPAA